jgi:hypothetical protein
VDPAEPLAPVVPLEPPFVVEEPFAVTSGLLVGGLLVDERSVRGRIPRLPYERADRQDGYDRSSLP